MDESPYGVIYMSLGTHMNPSAVANEMDSFMKAFNGLPQRVLLKLENDNFREVPSNVKIFNWFPQQGILGK